MALPFRSDPVRIRKAGIAAARRARFLAQNDLTRESLLKLRIQTCRPITRAVCVLLGLAMLAVALLFYTEGFPWWSMVIAVALALCLFSLAAFGRKKELDSVLNGLDAGVSQNVLSSIVDAIF